MRRTRVVESSPAAIVDLLRDHAALLDAAAAVRELRADPAIAERRRDRLGAGLEECAAAVLRRYGYDAGDLGALLRNRDATAVRAAAARYRQLADFEGGARTRAPAA
jgi:hypothetical protein